MRGSGWIMPLAGLVLWLGAVAWPAVAAVGELMTQPSGDYRARPLGELLATSVTWSVAVAAGAMLLGWLPGRVLGRTLHRRGFVLVAMLMLAPICLPSYVAFWAWWQAWPPDSELYRWAVATHRIIPARQATLWLGLVCWSWPLVAWCVAGWVAAVPAEHDEMLELDGAGRLMRFRDALRNDWRGLACGALVVFLATFNNTTCFDLAEVFTFGNELRVMTAEGAGTRDVLAAAWPAIAVAAAGAGAVWWLLAGRPRNAPKRTRGPAIGTRLGAAVIWGGSVAIPALLVARNVARFTSVTEFAKLNGEQGWNTIAFAGVCAALVALVAAGLAVMWQDRRATVRAIAHLQALGWLLAALAPSFVLSSSLEAAYNNDMFADAVYRSPLIVMIGHLASFGFIGALMGRWAAMREARSIVDLRALDGADTLRGQVTAGAPMLLAAAVSAGAVAGVLAMSEVVVTAQVAPAGIGLLAPTVLNALHYQRPETVAIATLATMGAALAAAGVAAALWQALRRNSTAIARLRGAAMLALMLPFLLSAMPGCARHDSSNPPPLDPVMIIGANGVTLGQFSYPRCIAVDNQRQYIYVIDKTARVQRFGFDGRPQLQWQMPEKDNGKPTGVSVAPDGRVFVADTHYFRVMAFDSEGHELLRFGSYGTGPGQFIYPTDIAFGPQGRLYVSEYGGDDRIQVFSPAGEFLFTFGRPGEGTGEFSRPQSMAFNADMTELYITDAINHRIVVVDPDGHWLRSFGGPGREPGQFNYPYGLAVLGDGSLMVAEFGGNRIQRVGPDGRPLGIWGAVGPEPGQVRYPWAVAASETMVYVLDSGNNRVQVVRRP